MNVVDEDIEDSQCRQLTAWRIHFQKIGVHLGRSGLKDQDGIIPLLHQLKRPTFFTLDRGFYHHRMLHQGYCLVFLDVWDNEAAEYIHRFLRHPAFRTQAQRHSRQRFLPFSASTKVLAKQPKPRAPDNSVYAAGDRSSSRPPWGIKFAHSHPTAARQLVAKEAWMSIKSRHRIAAMLGLCCS
jgi:hypothetical protein